MTPEDSTPVNPEPDDEQDLDPEFRLHELRREIENRGGFLGERSPDLPPDLEEAFLQNLLDYENAPMTTHLTLLERDGVFLPPPAEITDVEMAAFVRAFVDGLARRRTYLSSTDHLSDRELYTALWTDLCREWTPDFEPTPDYACHLDILGGCSEDDIRLQLMYYADDEERQRWIEHFPDYDLPESVKPPYDRDRFLPQPVYDKHEPADSDGTGFLDDDESDIPF